MFPGRCEVPKTLIFAKTDLHAEDVVTVVREEFTAGNDFCQKITSKADDPDAALKRFQNKYYIIRAMTTPSCSGRCTRCGTICSSMASLPMKRASWPGCTLGT